MAGEDAFESQETPDHRTAGEDLLLRILRTGGGVPAVAVGMEGSQRPVVRRQRVLVEVDQRNNDVAGKP